MEKIRNGLAGGMAILLLGLSLHYLPQIHYPLLMLGSIAASAVLLFAAPHSPMAQPWNLFGGHLLSALVGWGCSLLIPDLVFAAAVAVGAAILFMQLMHCLHPPGAATALTLVLSAAQFHGMGWQWAMYVVATNAGISLLLALVINNLLPDRKYPVPPPAAQRDPFATIEQSDIEQALAQMGKEIEVGKEELVELYRLALRQAQKRAEAERR
ncbi:MAG TPA: HPP family protein [Gallionella sp.]|nr:HPP family protein [Gallionella sp.]